MQGQRLYHVEFDEAADLPPAGSYWKSKHGWFARCPLGWLVANLSGHDVVEHDDGTITVAPSIRVSAPHRTDGVKEWHGYLERGTWRQV